MRSLISLWRKDGKPPRGHDSRCSTAKAAPQAQCVGVLVGAQPYLKAKASTKSKTEIFQKCQTLYVCLPGVSFRWN